MCIISELRNRLRDQNVEPIQTLRLVGVDIIICLGENRSSRQSWWGPEDMGGGAFAIELVGSGG